MITKSEVQNGIVFCNRKTDVDIVAKSLARHGIDAAPIHGDLEQSMRMRTLENFRKGALRILVASDVAARGLDIPAVSHVFNYDVPFHADDYVHRIGRTGRAGRTGEAFMIVTPDDMRNYDKVLKLTKKEPETVVLDVDWSAIDTDGDRGRRSSRDGRSDRSRRRAPGETTQRDPETTAEVEASPPRRAPRFREPPAEPMAREVAGGADDQPYVDAVDSSEGQARPSRESRSPRRAPRSPNADAGRQVRRDEYGGDNSGREGMVVGFGADTPAFLLRAAPIAPARKTAAAED